MTIGPLSSGHDLAGEGCGDPEPTAGHSPSASISILGTTSALASARAPENQPATASRRPSPVAREPPVFAMQRVRPPRDTLIGGPTPVLLSATAGGPLMRAEEFENVGFDSLMALCPSQTGQTASEHTAISSSTALNASLWRLMRRSR
ncbi:hypothetical protein BU16DRAFT_543301 [Lophium mytilinum]|uniref:Uncharacterized protein n=1 Tax=Lophium mytilinum TaxID=390894 RepID=A0A6A6QHB8_9PEZI|nr:hypothetical protein BU16DRAFT_543301 [Lophium mytilinum]